MVYKFRVILDTEEDIFRDIAILEEDSLEDLHNAIVNAFGFDGMEAASFYTCDADWAQQEEEIPLFDTGEIAGEQKTMAAYTINTILDQENNKIIYVYDFLNMWTFFVELAAIEEPQTGVIYPDLLFAHGELPVDSMLKNFDNAPLSEQDMFGEFDDEMDDEDFDLFDGDDSFEDFGYEDNWN